MISQGKKIKIKATFNQFACFWLHLSQFSTQESSSKSWKDSNKHTFHPLQKGKRHLGPVKMIKSITPYKQCEVWGGYNSICWNWEDTLIKRKKRHALCMSCISAPLCTSRRSLRSEKVLSHEGTNENYLLSLLPLLAGHRLACQSSPHPTVLLAC